MVPIQRGVKRTEWARLMGEGVWGEEAEGVEGCVGGVFGEMGEGWGFRGEKGEGRGFEGRRGWTSSFLYPIQWISEMLRRAKNIF